MLGGISKEPALPDETLKLTRSITRINRGDESPACRAADQRLGSKAAGEFDLSSEDRSMRWSAPFLALLFALSAAHAGEAAGGIRVELQNAAGEPIPGFTLDDSVETIGNEIERRVRWKQGADVGALAGQPVRLRFVMQDADLFALRFAEEKP